MPKSAMIRARVEPRLKHLAEGVLGEIGLSPTTAITLLYRAIVIQNGLPIDLHIPNAETRRAMRDVKAGRVIKADSMEHLFELLDAPEPRKRKKAIRRRVKARR
jgi:DNA-damage-inducible protein J